MFVARISISREGYYSSSTPDPTKPFQATVEVHGQHGKVQLNLSPDLSARVVAIIADEIAAAGRAAAEALTAACLTALPAPDGPSA
jgi:hypothetical protein